MRRLLTAIVVSLALVSAAAAAVSPSTWTPAQARAELVAPHTLIYGSENGPALGGIVAIHSASCHGLGKAVKGTFGLFSCAISLTSRATDGVSTVTAWVRPWSASAMCVTQASAGACPPPMPAHLVRNDPRACGLPNIAVCMQQRAAAAIVTQRRTDGQRTESNLTCQAATAFVYQCSWNAGAGVGTVKFVAGSSTWTTVVTTND